MGTKIREVFWTFVIVSAMTLALGMIHMIAVAKASAAPEDVAWAVYADGQEVCDILRVNGVVKETMVPLVITIAANHPITLEEAAFVVADSVVLYCNDLQPALMDLIYGPTVLK